MNDQAYVTSFYKREAADTGASLASTIHDDVVREKELDLIQRFLTVLCHGHGRDRLRILDLGCGNGGTLGVVAEAATQHQYFGLDYCDELIEIATGRPLPNCEFRAGDAAALPYNDAVLDVVFTERCLINLLAWDSKAAALKEIHRVLCAGGYYLMIEGFADGIDNNNRVRAEVDLPPLSPPKHNAYFENEAFEECIEGKFRLVTAEAFDPDADGAGLEPNFLSTHYFMGRVLHALLTKDQPQRKNTEFVKFFSFLPPIGNYSPIQARILQKI